MSSFYMQYVFKIIKVKYALKTYNLNMLLLIYNANFGIANIW